MLAVIVWRDFVKSAKDRIRPTVQQCVWFVPEGTIHDRTNEDGRVGECLLGATVEIGPELVQGLVQSLSVEWLREMGATIP